MIIHEPPLDWERLYKKHRDFYIKKVIGFTVWETEDLPESWVDAMNARFIDEIWCPTEYNKEVFKKSGVEKNIRVVPHVWMGKILPSVEKSKNYVFFENYSYKLIYFINSNRHYDFMYIGIMYIGMFNDH